MEGDEPADIAMDDPNVQNLVAEVSIKVICSFIFCEIEIIWCQKALVHIFILFLFFMVFLFDICVYLPHCFKKFQLSWIGVLQKFNITFQMSF